MRLSEFISCHRERILEEWVTFARSRFPAAVSLAVLRDHASELLDTIADDLNTSQTKSQQADKSEGKSDAEPQPGGSETAAQAHGAGRADSGLTVEEMVSEYRALRASVTRLWIETTGELTRQDLEDLVRFNEAIDQALAESISRYTQEIDQSKEMFIAMLSHDLRTPLGAIIGQAHVMANTPDVPETFSKKASVILRSGHRMNALVENLLDFTRSRLGRGIPIIRVQTDLVKVGRHTVEEIAAMHPERVVRFEASGELEGQWDEARVSQAMSNVINNAVQHGSASTPISVTIRDDGDEVRLAVHNSGPVIPAKELSKIFNPMHRIEVEEPVAPRSNLGLGLYIADRIVVAHGGTIDVESSTEKGTTFIIHLPKHTTSPSAERVGLE